jgi:RimJ/RimL family protein N-acetyltransferase
LPPLALPDPPLTDGVVALRDFRHGDIDPMVRACSDPFIVRYCGGIPQPYGPDQARGWLATHPHARRAGTEMPLCIADAESGELLGATGLHKIEWDHHRTETGYWVAPWARGRGVASRALSLLAGWTLGDLGFGRVHLYTETDNVVSQAVARAAGFEEEGCLRSFLEIRGERRDAIVFSRTRSASGAAGRP